MSHVFKKNPKKPSYNKTEASFLAARHGPVTAAIPEHFTRLAALWDMTYRHWPNGGFSLVALGDPSVGWEEGSYASFYPRRGYWEFEVPFEDLLKDFKTWGEDQERAEHDAQELTYGLATALMLKERTASATMKNPITGVSTLWLKTDPRLGPINFSGTRSPDIIKGLVTQLIRNYFDVHPDAPLGVEGKNGKTEYFFAGKLAVARHLILENQGYVIQTKQKNPSEKKVIDEFEIEYIGVEHSDYFHGRSSGKWDVVFVGIGSSEREGLEDALEQAAQYGLETDYPEMDEELERASDKDEVERYLKDVPEKDREEASAYYHVALFVKEKGGSRKNPATNDVMVWQNTASHVLTIAVHNGYSGYEIFSYDPGDPEGGLSHTTSLLAFNEDPAWGKRVKTSAITSRGIPLPFLRAQARKFKGGMRENPSRHGIVARVNQYLGDMNEALNSLEALDNKFQHESTGRHKDVLQAAWGSLERAYRGLYHIADSPRTSNAVSIKLAFEKAMLEMDRGSSRLEAIDEEFQRRHDPNSQALQTIWRKIEYIHKKLNALVEWPGKSRKNPRHLTLVKARPEYYDNGGRTVDRYTAIIPILGSNMVDVISMSSDPSDPQGVWGVEEMGSTEVARERLGRKIDFFELPAKAQNAIIRREFQRLQEESSSGERENPRKGDVDRKRIPKGLTKAEEFFFRQAGYSHDPKKESSREGLIRAAKSMAHDEAEAKRRGLSVTWRDEEERYEDVFGKGPDAAGYDVQAQIDSDEILCLWGAVIHDGHTLASLGMVTVESMQDPYVRVVEAELLGEALHELEKTEGPQRITRGMATRRSNPSRLKGRLRSNMVFTLPPRPVKLQGAARPAPKPERRDF